MKKTMKKCLTLLLALAMLLAMAVPAAAEETIPVRSPLPGWPRAIP